MGLWRPRTHLCVCVCGWLLRPVYTDTLNRFGNHLGCTCKRSTDLIKPRQATCRHTQHTHTLTHTHTPPRNRPRSRSRSCSNSPMSRLDSSHRADEDGGTAGGVPLPPGLHQEVVTQGQWKAGTLVQYNYRMESWNPSPVCLLEP